jgi:hypothetical protein
VFFPVFPYPTGFCFIASKYLVHLPEVPILPFKASQRGGSSIAVRIVEIPIAGIVRVATVIVVPAAVFRARFVLFRTRVPSGADIFVRGRDSRVLVILRAGSSARLSVFVVLVDVPVVAAVVKFVEIAAISAGTRDI